MRGRRHLPSLASQETTQKSRFHPSGRALGAGAPAPFHRQRALTVASGRPGGGQLPARLRPGRGCRIPARPAPTRAPEPSAQCPHGRPGWRGPPGRGQLGTGGGPWVFAPRRSRARGSPAGQRDALVPPESQETSDRKFVSPQLGPVVKPQGFREPQRLKTASFVSLPWL